MIFVPLPPEIVTFPAPVNATPEAAPVSVTPQPDPAADITRSSLSVINPLKYAFTPALLPMMLVFAAELAWTIILLAHVLLPVSAKRAAVAVPVVSPK